MRIGSREGWRAAAVVLLVAAAIPARAQSQGGPTAAMDGRWHFTVAPYMWFTGIKGELSVANVTVPVDASFSDLWENFDIGFDGRFEARKDRVGFGVDFVWSNLGVPVASSVQLADLNVDVRQVITEGFAFYRVASGGRSDNPANLDVRAGARYTSTNARLTAAGAGGAAYDGEYQQLSWVDALAGLRFRAPLGSRMAFLGSADIAGFGSNLTWNVEGDLAFRASEHWTIGAGWRHLDIDYDNESPPVKQYDLAYDGPRVWFAYSW